MIALQRMVLQLYMVELSGFETVSIGSPNSLAVNVCFASPELRLIALSLHQARLSAKKKVWGLGFSE
jgi:hypothetical protein